MNSEAAPLRLTHGVAHRRRVIPRQLILRLTAAERKLLLALIDMVLINGSLVAATTFWNGFDPSSALALQLNAKWFITVSVVWWGFGTILDVYDLARSASTTSIIKSAGLAALLAALVYLFIPWLTPPIKTRSYIFGFVLLCEITILGWRTFYAQALNQPAFWRRALILGTGAAAQALLQDLNQASRASNANPFRSTGYRVIGLVSDSPSEAPDGDSGAPLLGDVSQLVRQARLHDVDEVIVALDDERASALPVYQVLLDCREVGLRVSPIVDVYERLTARLLVDYCEYNLPALWMQTDSPSARLYIAIKSLMDWVLALLGLVVLALVMPWVALGNALWSPGPLFYRQQRVGKGGRPFAVIKFRSMVVNAEQVTGAMWSKDDDPRITPIGRWLRKTRLDELPQVINVLRGEMSIVGPRPERPHFVGPLAHELPLYRVRHSVKPGITGWAQVRYQYADSIESSRIKLEYDLYYVKHAGLYLDLLILLQTVNVMLRLRGK